MTSYDVVVIGGGAGGLVAAKEARRRHASVVIIQDGPLGGDRCFTRVASIGTAADVRATLGPPANSVVNNVYPSCAVANGSTVGQQGDELAASV